LLASESFYGSELHDAEECLSALDRTARFFRDAGDERESLFWSVQLGRAYTDFDRIDKARVRLADALARARAIGDRRTEGFASFGLGGVLLSAGELEAATGRYRDAIAILAEVGKERDRGYALGYLGVAEHLRGRTAEAEAAYTEGCEVLTEVGDEPNRALFSLFLAGLFADEDKARDAGARFTDAKARVARWVGSGARPTVAAVTGAMLDACRARSAWRAGDLSGFTTHRASAIRALREAEGRPETIATARETYDWRDVALDVRLAHRLAKRAVDGLDAFRVPSTCIVAEPGCWRVRLAGDAPWVDLRSRRVLRTVLERLVAERLAAPGAVVPASALVEAGWPGKELAPSVAINRLHVTLGSLRRLGFEETLEHVGGGWRLRTDVPLVRAEEGELSR
jgi:tetratricopeptide (TPR) repeat protein